MPVDQAQPELLAWDSFPRGVTQNIPDTALQTIKMQRAEKLKGKAQKLIAVFVLAFLIDA